MPRDLQRARELFLYAVGQLPPEQWDAYVSGECGPDGELQAHVLHLLAVHREAGSFLERPVAGVAATSAFTPSPDDTAVAGAEDVGAAIGPYRLLEEIGAGGMGTVWMAEQTEPVKRRVALKLVKPGMDSRQLLTRFEAERQALALMDHPNIAKVLDAGATPQGRPYFVMELVKGVPITRYCDEHRLTVRQRLELFVLVCQALQHAHQKGIIHRDVKPSNVLVALYDGRPVPKVIDFGIAKATGPQLTEQTLVTGFGALVGTLEYMSPEQAELGQLDVDTRSDVYSLGVLLYELLTGTTPLERRRLKEASILEVLRVIREEEPPRPSTRLRQDEGRRKEDESTLTMHSDWQRLLPFSSFLLPPSSFQELDWIVMKALDKDRSRRYETASAFAADVQRYLADEPVQAAPPSAGYRLRKLARRHRAGLTVGLVVTLALGAALASLFWGGRVAEQRDQAEVAKEEARGAEAEAEKARREEARQRALVERLRYFGDADRAQRCGEAGEYGRMRQLLDGFALGRPGQPDLPGFEYHYLERQCRLLRTLKGHGRDVMGVAWSPDGQRIASASADKTVRVCDARTGREILVLRGHKGEVAGLSWSPDGKRLASASDDKTVRVWDADTGRTALVLEGHTDAVLCVAWSPDGRSLASGGSGWAIPPGGRGMIRPGSDNTVRVWDARTGKEMRTFRGHQWVVNRVAWSPDSKRIASASADRTVRVWDTESGKQTLTMRGHDHMVRDVAWSPDGRQLASGGDDTVRLWEVRPGGKGRILEGHTNYVQGVSWSPDGKHLASASADQTVRVWDADGGQTTLVLKGHTGVVRGVAWAPDSRRLATASSDRTVRVWDTRTGTEALVFSGHKGAVYGASWAPDGRHLASGSADGTVRVWEAHTAQEERKLVAASGASMQAGPSWSPDGKRLAGAANHGTLVIWEARTGKEVLRLPGRDCLSWSPDGRRLAVAHREEKKFALTVWDAQSGRDIVALQGHTYYVRCVACSPDGKRLASASADETVRLWDAESGAEVLTIRGGAGAVWGVCWSPDGGRLAGACDDGTVRIWEADSGREVLALRGHTVSVRAVAWSPDGQRIASASADQTVRLWETQTGQEALVLKGHTGMVQSVSWSPDGRQLASASVDGTVRVWSARTEDSSP